MALQPRRVCLKNTGPGETSVMACVDGSTRLAWREIAPCSCPDWCRWRTLWAARKTPAVGLSGVDGDLILARKRPVRRVKDPETGAEQDVDFQNVGDVVDERVVAGRGAVPVIRSRARGALPVTRRRPAPGGRRLHR